MSPVADGIVFSGSWDAGTAHVGGGNDTIHLFQQYALEAQRCYQHPVALLSQLLHGKVLEHIGSFLANAMVCRNEGIVRVKLTGLFVVVAGADLGDIRVAPLCSFLVIRVSLECTL